MQTHISLDALPAFPNGCAVTIGNFDGVHLGHQSLLHNTVQHANAAQIPSVVITFDPHPLQMLLGGNAPPLLMQTNSKLACFAGSGIQHCLIIPFTREFAAQSPEDFTRAVLVDALHAKHLTIGYDYSFGKGRTGNATLLSRLGQQYGFTLAQMPPVQVDHSTVSSTSIRLALTNGDVEQAARQLGRPHFVHGIVTTGQGRGGKSLGFPTANLDHAPQFLLPSNGVYAVLAEVDDTPDAFTHTPPLTAKKLLSGVANVGVNPTFGDASERVETFLFDFDQDIYGAAMRVYFIQRLRDEKKFDGIPALVEQITRDVTTAKDMIRAYTEAGHTS